MVAASAAQSAATVVQAGTKDLTSKVNFCVIHILVIGLNKYTYDCLTLYMISTMSSFVCLCCIGYRIRACDLCLVDTETYGKETLFLS